MAKGTVRARCWSPRGRGHLMSPVARLTGLRYLLTLRRIMAVAKEIQQRVEETAPLARLGVATRARLIRHAMIMISMRSIRQSTSMRVRITRWSDGATTCFLSCGVGCRLKRVRKRLIARLT
ncbi:MAG: hypothetical protein MPJ50_12895 [Pirellulales bacterium]|nr:hypothetical protein [Pirellulales bacterium]